MGEEISTPHLRLLNLVIGSIAGFYRMPSTKRWNALIALVPFPVVRVAKSGGKKVASLVASLGQRRRLVNRCMRNLRRIGAKVKAKVTVARARVTDPRATEVRRTGAGETNNGIDASGSVVV